MKRKRSRAVIVGLPILVFLIMSVFVKGCLCFGCFVAGTLIATPRGPVPIEQLRPGDMVWSYDHQTDAVVARKVRKVWRFSMRPYRHLSLPDGQLLKVTGTHPIYDAQRSRYVPVASLATDARLLSLGASLAPATGQRQLKGHQLAPLNGVSRTFWRGVTTVYTITVEGTHNYFANGLLVHNKSFPPQPIKCSAHADCPRDLPLCLESICTDRCSSSSDCPLDQRCDVFTFRCEPITPDASPDSASPEITPDMTTEHPPEVTVDNTAERTPEPVVSNQEQPVTPIALSGDAASADAEFSGMAWYKDHLILLPQYPAWGTSRDNARLYAIPKQVIRDYLSGKNTNPITPKAIKFDDQGLNVTGFDGYEAIAFVDNTVYLTIEARTTNGATGHMIKGSIQPDLSEIKLEPSSFQAVPARSQLSNTSDETLIATKDALYTIYEANGTNVTPSPTALVFGFDLKPKPAVSFPTVEYRITDATAPDASGRFWAINFFFPGDKDLLKPGDDKPHPAYAKGTTHQQWPQVERLIEFAIGPNGITTTDTPILQLQLSGADNSRNWEGIVRFDDKGFLLITDKYPSTILAFVPLPK